MPINMTEHFDSAREGSQGASIQLLERAMNRVGGYHTVRYRGRLARQELPKKSSL